MPALPRVSILLPVRNEERFITECLRHILNQDYPAELMEILIADGLSTDATRARIDAVGAGDRLHVLTNPQRVQAAGMNQMLRHATGDIIIRVDGHTFIAPDYVRCCVAALTATAADEVGGNIAPVGLTPVGTAIAAASRSSFAVPGAFHTGTEPCWTDTVYLGAWPRAVLQRLGGYAEDLPANEDYELNYRLRQGGGRIWFDPAIRSTYHGRQTFAALGRQYFTYGVGKAAMLRRHPQSLRWRQVVAPLFVAGCVVGALGAIWLPPVRLIWGAVLLLYAALALLAARRVAGAGARLPLVLWAFVTVHLSWGSGFWWGWLRAARRQRADTATKVNQRTRELVHS